MVFPCHIQLVQGKSQLSARRLDLLPCLHLLLHPTIPQVHPVDNLVGNRQHNPPSSPFVVQALVHPGNPRVNPLVNPQGSPPGNPRDSRGVALALVLQVSHPEVQPDNPQANHPRYLLDNRLVNHPDSRPDNHPDSQHCNRSVCPQVAPAHSRRASRQDDLVDSLPASHR